LRPHLLACRRIHEPGLNAAVTRFQLCCGQTANGLAYSAADSPIWDIYDQGIEMLCRHLKPGEGSRRASVISASDLLTALLNLILDKG